MLKVLKGLRDRGLPKEMLEHYAKYRVEFLCMPLRDRAAWGFDYFLRMKYIEFLKKKSI